MTDDHTPDDHTATPDDHTPDDHTNTHAMADSTATNDPTTTDDSITANDSTTEDPTDRDGGSRFTRLTSEDLRGILDRLALAALAVLALIAAWSFYGYAGTAIRTWLDPAYQPIALAAFNLAILFVALAGVAHQLQRIRGGAAGEPSSTADTGDGAADG